MKKLIYHHLDSFTKAPFTGNPADVFILQEPLSDSVMQKIATELNVPVTAFLIPNNKNENPILRWFNPIEEVKLCGHASLATAKIFSLK